MSILFEEFLSVPNVSVQQIKTQQKHIEKITKAMFPGFGANSFEKAPEDYYYMPDGGQNDEC